HLARRAALHRCVHLTGGHGADLHHGHGADLVRHGAQRQRAAGARARQRPRRTLGECHPDVRRGAHLLPALPRLAEARGLRDLGDRALVRLRAAGARVHAEADPASGSSLPAAGGHHHCVPRLPVVQPHRVLVGVGHRLEAVRGGDHRLRSARDLRSPASRQHAAVGVPLGRLGACLAGRAGDHQLDRLLSRSGSSCRQPWGPRLRLGHSRHRRVLRADHVDGCDAPASDRARGSPSAGDAGGAARGHGGIALRRDSAAQPAGRPLAPYCKRSQRLASSPRTFSGCAAARVISRRSPSLRRRESPRRLPLLLPSSPMRHLSLVSTLLAVMTAAAPSLLAQQTPAAPAAPDASSRLDSVTLAGMAWRNIGPANMGGRVADIVGIPSPSKTFYVAAAGGGIWKTTNAGTTFRPIFEHERVVSMGALAIAPSDTNIVWAGTGEQNSRNSIMPGGGIYKSTDGGMHWQLMGLEQTQQIARIVVDPRNADVVYVAALGHAWEPNKDRGLYKTTDGGKSWKLIKFVSDRAGFIDVAMDPKDPNTLYASSYERIRTPWSYTSGGPGS